MSSPQKSYLIVGAGVFGVSTAYHLIKKYPDASVTIVDRDHYAATSRVAASWDWNKVVRADYEDILYCRLALEAQDVFRSQPLWKPFFHETGIFWVCRTDYAQRVIDNYARLGRTADLKAISVEDAKRLYGALFDQADYAGGVKSVLINKTSGWAAAGDCLQAVTREVVRLGVRFVTAEVDSLRFDDGGRCVGVGLAGGRDDLRAAHVILSTGAFTAKLLEWSAHRSGKPGLRACDRIRAGGVTTGMTRLSDADYGRFARMPVGVQSYDPATGPYIGSLPPNPTDRELKWWGRTIFANTSEVFPGRHISAPPAEPDYAQWKVSRRLREDIDHARTTFYGAASDHWKIEKHRICWDAFTSSADFIISPHAAAPGLFLATCGNFHGWKFFPVIGKYVVQMLEGALEPALADKWAWNRARPDSSGNGDWPRAEYHALQDPVRSARL